MISYCLIASCLLSLFFAKSRVSKTLIFILFGSISSSVFLGEDLPLNTSAFGYAVFVYSILIILFTSFNGLDGRRIGIYMMNSKELIVIKFIIALSMIGVLSNVYISIGLINDFIFGGFTVEVFKNAGVGLSYYQQINIVPRTASAIFSPLSYLCLPLHFFFLVHKQSRLSNLSFFASLNIILEQLAFLGRGGMVVFIMIYLLMLVFVYPKLTSEMRKGVVRTALAVLLLISCAFIYIAVDRFSEYDAFEYDALITNPVVVSLLSYYSQWLINGYNIYSDFEENGMIIFGSFMYIPNRILEIFGAAPYDIIGEREAIFGSQATYFNGLPALLLYDLHYIGAYFFATLYYLCNKLFIASGKTNGIGKYQFVFAGLMMPIPAMFFQGMHTVHGGYNIAFIYFIILFFFVKFGLGKVVAPSTDGGRS